MIANGSSCSRAHPCRRTRLRQHDGVEFKHTGDGIGATFFTAGAAVQSLGIQDDIDKLNESHDEPFQIRIGLSAGSVINNEGDMFGLAVVEAFRVNNHATEADILVSPDVPPLVHGGEAFTFRSIGEIALKGFSNTRTLYEVIRVGKEARSNFVTIGNVRLMLSRPRDWRGSPWVGTCPISSKRGRTSRSPKRCSTTSNERVDVLIGLRTGRRIPTTMPTLRSTPRHARGRSRRTTSAGPPERALVRQVARPARATCGGPSPLRSGQDPRPTGFWHNWYGDAEGIVRGTYKRESRSHSGSPTTTP